MVKYGVLFDSRATLEITPGDEPTIELRVYDTLCGGSPALTVAGHTLTVGGVNNNLSPTATNSTLANVGLLNVIFSATASAALAPGKQDAQLETVLTNGKRFVIPLPNAVNVRPRVF